MLDRILIPLDGSTASDAILLAVRTILEREGAKTTLLGVVEDEGEELPEHLARQQAVVESWGGRAEVVIRRGAPAAAVLEFAGETAPSLVAMSTHGRSGLARLWRGSVAERVLRHAGHPLLLLNPHHLAENTRARGRGFSPILVPLDGSDASSRILPFVEAMARIYRARVVLQFAADVVDDENPRQFEMRVLGPFRRRMEEAGVETRSRVDADTPVAAILDAIGEEDAGLVAMTTHGRSGPSRWLFGSVAENVLRAAPIPLLVVRSQGAP